MIIKKIDKISSKLNYIVLTDSINNIVSKNIDSQELKYIRENYSEGNKCFTFNHFTHQLWVCIIDKADESHIVKEEYRKEGAKLYSDIASKEIEEVVIEENSDINYSIYFAEGIVL